MAQTRRGSVSHTNRNTYNSRTARNSRAEASYIYDNTARKLDVRRQLEEAPRKPLSHETRKNREKAQHMSFGYVAFLVLATLACGVILTYYIQLQSELTTKREAIAALESELNTIRIANDEELNRIESSIDLEEIKGIAIGELGMTYAQEGQIIPYSNEGNDYMRRVADDEK